jgi:hypothetical protein
MYTHQHAIGRLDVSSPTTNDDNAPARAIDYGIIRGQREHSKGFHHPSGLANSISQGDVFAHVAQRGGHHNNRIVKGTHFSQGIFIVHVDGTKHDEQAGLKCFRHDLKRNIGVEVQIRQVDTTLQI